MKTFFSRIFLRFSAIAGVFIAATAFAAPPTSVTITAPTDNFTGRSNTQGISLEATATPSASGSITSVAFRVNDTLVATDTVPSAGVYAVSWFPTAPGNYVITAVATDSSSATGNTLTSAPINVTITGVRTAAVAAPTANTIFPLGSSTFARATASMTDGVVRDVVFVLTGTGGPFFFPPDSSSPFTAEIKFNTTDLPGLTTGTYNVLAQVTDTDGVMYESLPVPVSVVTPAGTAPTVQVTAPSATDVIGVGNAVTISANATDSDGTISSVAFFVDGEQIGTSDTTAPYSVTWTPVVVKANYVITAQAIDNQFNARLSTSVTVAVKSSAPTVALTAPTGALNVGVPVTLTATATPTAGTTITSVAFFADNQQITTPDTTSPYNATWTPQNTGTVSLFVKATDSNDNTVESATINVTVGTTSAPTVVLATPTSTTVAVGTTVPLTAQATAAAGLTISSVTFSAGGAQISVDNAAPYTANWIPTATGSYALTATALDSVGVSGFSNTVNVTVIPAGSSTVTVTLTGPTSIAAGSTRLYTATATPATGVERVEFLVEDQVVATDTAAPYSFLFTAPSVLGAHRLTARAYTTTGTSGTSEALAVNVTGATGTPPLVSITSPSANAILAPSAPTTISGTMSDPDGTVTSVQVFVNDTALTGAVTLSGGTWSITWTTPTAPGPASIVAIATDNSGNSVASPALGVNVGDSTSPAITLSISPSSVANQNASTTFPSGAVRNFVANVTPSSGRAVVRVEFFVEGTKVGEDTSFPFTFRYAAPPLEGDEQNRPLVFGARATDNAGAARDVQIPLLIVQPIGQRPNVNLVTPANGAQVIPGAPVSFAATATANGGTITSVQFYVNGNPANVISGTTANPVNGLAITNPPYTATYTPTAPGSYTVDVIATDDRGNTTVSNSATFTAAFVTPTVVFNTPNPNAVARATPGVPLNLTATATVQTGTGTSILSVEFLLDGAPLGADTTPTANNQFSISWVPTTAQLGQHVLTARVTDTNSQTSVSAPITVNVANVVGSPPTVSVTAGPIPALFGLQTASTVNFVATAVATGGTTLSNVDIYLNDILIGAAAREQTTNFYRLAYDLSRFDFAAVTPVINETTGAVTYPLRLFAIARDSNNNQTVSSTVNLTVNPATSAPPTIQLLAGTPTLTVTVGTQFFMFAVPGDSDGVVTQVQLFANGLATGPVIFNPQSGQQITYTPTNAGRFNLYAVATDDTGNTAVSTPSIVLNVTAVSPPTTTITRPNDNTTTASVLSPVFLEGTAVNTATPAVPTLQFIASSASGSRQVITGIRNGATSVYRAIWTPINPDTYTITTQASVGAVQGTSTTSRRVVVSEILGLAPTVTLTRAPGQSGVPGTASTASTADFAATATDPDGSIVGVEFFLNRNSVGQAVKDPQGNTWRVTAPFAGLQPGATEVVALARDSSGNIVASPTSNINVVAATSIAPSISLTLSTTNPAFNRAVQLRANARDSDGTVNSVQYFANATSIGTSTNAGSLFLTSWTPTTSGTYYIWAVATDNTGITRVAERVEVNVRQNNPVLENSAFILQTYQDINNTTTINPLVFDQLDEQLANGTLTRADIIVSPLTANGGVALTELPGFQPPVNLLAVYYVLMGHWPTPANYTTFLATARGGLANAVGSILSANEYFAKYGIVPTAAILNNPNGPLPAAVFLDQLWANAGARPNTTRETDLVRFMSNNVASPTVGRGYGPAGLNAAIAEFVTNTNSTNTALFNKARTAALFYQLTRPPITVSVDEITARIDALLRLPNATAVADAILKDILYGYRYVTITRQPQSLVLNARSGAIFTVEAQGAPPLAYQWLLNGAPIAGATTPTLSLTNVDATRVGTYTVAITSPAAAATSDRATLTLSTTVSKLANISTRGVTQGGSNVMIGGFVVTAPNANQTRQMLIRVVGPTLAQAPFNVTGVLADPRLEVYSRTQATPVLTNDNWASQAGGAAQVTAIQQATNRAGAFTLPANSNDAVVLATLAPGLYTVMAHPPANNPNASGVVLIEVYDVTQGGAAGPKAANVSTRGAVGTGNNILIAGFVVDGAVSRRMLIRGAGPTLSAFGIPGVLADPQLTLVDQSTGRTIRTNDNWASGNEDAAVIAQAATTSGAFPLGNGSRDAAMIVMLPPGAYTVQLSGVGNTTGVGIVEVYDVDP